LASKAANWIRDAVLKDECPDTGCGIKVYGERHSFGCHFSREHAPLSSRLFLSYGHEVAYVPVIDRPRQAGQSKYNN